MKFLCYKNKSNIPEIQEYYCGMGGGVRLYASDLAQLGEMLSQYAENDGDPRGFILCGNTRNQNIRDAHIPNPQGLPKRVLEELALIIKNKTESKREVGVAA